MCPNQRTTGWPALESELFEVVAQLSPLVLAESSCSIPCTTGQYTATIDQYTVTIGQCTGTIGQHTVTIGQYTENVAQHTVTIG